MASQNLTSPSQSTLQFGQHPAAIAGTMSPSAANDLSDPFPQFLQDFSAREQRLEKQEALWHQRFVEQDQEFVENLYRKHEEYDAKWYDRFQSLYCSCEEKSEQIKHKACTIVKLEVWPWFLSCLLFLIVI